MTEVDRPPVKLDGEAASPDLRAEVSMTCFFGNCDYAETYGAADLSLTLIGTGATRSLYMLTGHEAGTRRLMFDMRIEAELDDLMARARRAKQSTDRELRDLGVSYARHVVDSDACRHAPHSRLEIGLHDEVLEALGRKGDRETPRS